MSQKPINEGEVTGTGGNATPVKKGNNLFTYIVIGGIVIITILMLIKIIHTI